MTSDRSPLIGITTRRLSASALPYYPVTMHGLTLDYVVSDYARGVAGAGGTPVLIPSEAPVETLLQCLDGLVLTGGEDVTPSLYGAVEGPHATVHDRQRDEFELAIISAALARQIPILAICRGIQILNVALGGTLVPHLEEVDGFTHAMTDMAPSVRRHGVKFESDSELARVMGIDKEAPAMLSVNSFHHQAILEAGHPLRVVAWADDGTIEGVEIPNRAVIGVQWHPEMHEGVDPVFAWLCSAARNNPVRIKKENSDANIT
jgi:putative glutamine amidotransferase